MNILTLTLALLLCFFNTCRALECAGEDKTYIADISTGCQVYHICDHSEVKTLRCSSGQAFNSQTTKCEDASTVPCYLTLKRSKVDMSFFNRFVNGQPTNSNSADLARSIEIPLQTAKEAAPAAKIEIHIEQPPKKAEEPRSWIDGFGLFHIVAMGVLLLVILCCFMCCGCCLCIHYIGAATCDFIEESSNIKRQDRDCVKQDRNSAKQTRIKI